MSSITCASCGSLDATWRCSACKLMHYCSKLCQKNHFKVHKKDCCKEKSCEDISTGKSESFSDKVESRSCRCMFCGQVIIVSSEEEAIQHMSECSLLQEQLNGEGQFTVPKEFLGGK